MILLFVLLDIGTTGEVLLIHNISRFCGGIYEREAQNDTFFMLLLFILLDIGTTGEVLLIHNISRFCGGIYECEAQNGAFFYDFIVCTFRYWYDR